MHCINRKWSEKEVIGAIAQGIICIASRSSQNLALAGLEDYPMMTCLNNDNWKHNP
jgi:hypothetical protein